MTGQANELIPKDRKSMEDEMSITSDQPPLLAMAVAAVRRKNETCRMPSLTLRRWILLLYALALTISLLVPQPIRSADPQVKESLYIFGKTVHIVAYATFTALAGWVLLPARYRWVLVVMLIGHGMLTEWVQYITYDILGRTGQWSDVGLDAIGIAVGLALTCKWWLAPDKHDKT